MTRPRKPSNTRSASFRATVSKLRRRSTAPNQDCSDLTGFDDPSAVRNIIARLCADPSQRRHLDFVLPDLLRVCAKSADPHRALVNFERLASSLPHRVMFYQYLAAAPDRLELLARIFAHSQAMADTLVRNAQNLHFLIAPATLASARSKNWLDADLRRLLMATRQPEEACHIIRRFRRREMLRIGTRDLMGLASVEQTTFELSNLADVCLQAVFETMLKKLASACKLDVAQWAAARQFSVIGMGKLGGQELNYSSDVDVIFIYAEDAPLTPRMTKHEFFSKLAALIIEAVGAATDEGTIFRIDLRLRPEGRTGPLVSSLDACEQYYAEYGETWERMALVKARPVAGDLDLGLSFIQMVQPFVYRRYTGQRIIQQMAALKQRIESEIVRNERLDRHVKLGIGGIREIEFIVQSFQVLRGARLVALRERSTLKALNALAHAKTLSRDDVHTLAEAYRFLRNVEHRLQMEMELQTHTIPDEQRALFRLANSLGFDSIEAFQQAQTAHTGAVRRIYQAVLATAVALEHESPPPSLTPDAITAQLKNAGFTDLPVAVKTVDILQNGPGFGHVSQRTKELFTKLFPAIIQSSSRLTDPDAALARFEKFVSAYGSRGLLYETLATNPKLAALLLQLADNSAFLMDTLLRSPDLFDEICRGALLAEPKNTDRMREELRQYIAAAGQDVPASESARHWHQTELLRIGMEDILSLIDLERLGTEITQLATACLDAGIEIALRDTRAGRLPFCVIGMGKLGGQELGYGADLDVLFVCGDDANPTKAIGVANKIIEFMGQPTSSGILFKVDARLRPDGEKGVLVSSISAHGDYYRHRAQLWERQALTKARYVAGDADLGNAFMRMAHDHVYQDSLTPKELRAIRQMRHRIETQRGDQHLVTLEFKTGPGGLMDIEFLVQALQLQHGHDHPGLRTAHTLAALNRLTALGIVDDEQSYHLRKNYLWLRQIESILRRQDNTSISRLPSAEKDQARLAKRMGFETVNLLMENYHVVRQQNRAILDVYLPSN